MKISVAPSMVIPLRQPTNEYVSPSPSQVTVLQDDGILAEYVHILADSARVAPGDRVSAGQPLCESGDAGFCPTPHLHLQLQEGEDDSAPTVLFALLDHDGNPYFPVAGKWYGSRGEMEAPSEGKKGNGWDKSVQDGQPSDKKQGLGTDARCGTDVNPLSR